MSDAAGRTVATVDGRQVRLGKLIKSGGAGSVYPVDGDADCVAKLYHPTIELAMYARKVAAMLELRPKLPGLRDGELHIVQLAWPQAALFDPQRRFVGYLMPTVDFAATSELECVLQERQARQLQLPTGLGAKVTLAANLCTVVAELHRQRHYIVDLKPVNLRFYRRSLYLALLDCDGFSIQGQGERFAAPQFTPEYLAPEFHANGLTVSGEAQQDRFALAVVVFQLLNFGIHPFTGRPASNQVPTDIPARIAGRWYAHGLRGNASLLPSPSSGHAAMPLELRTLFDRAFDNAGASRPSADEWSDLLRGYAQRAAGKLRVCTRDATHQHFTGQACAACARAGKIADAKLAAASAPRRSTLPPPPPPPRTKPTPRTAPARTPARPPLFSRMPPTPPPAWPTPRPTAHATLARAKPFQWNSLVLPVVIFIYLFVRIGLPLWNALDREGPSPRATPLPRVAPPQPSPAAVDPEPVRLAPRATLDAFAPVVDAIALGVAGGDPSALRQLPVLRADARQPRDPGEASATEAFDAGWRLLARGQRKLAADAFLHAIRADPDFADAWYGYALVHPDREYTKGAMTVALLLYPDPHLAQARFDAALRDAWPQLPVTREDFFATFAKARDNADLLRPRLAPETFTGVSAPDTAMEAAGRGPMPGLPYPHAVELDAVETGLERIAAALYAKDADTVARELGGLRAVSRARRKAWGTQALQRPVVGPVLGQLSDDGIRQDATRLAAEPFNADLAQDLGWRLVRARDFGAARHFLLQALWADPANAESWLGYGLARRDTGAIAMGLLLGKPSQIRARRTQARGLLAASATGEEAQDVDATLDEAEGIARRMRRQVLAAMSSP